MEPPEQPPDEHQVGITNAQVNNPDSVIAEFTKQMNAHFAAEQYSEAAAIALRITERSREELRETFDRHGVNVLHLDHEAFGIYEDQIEPAYDVHVEGSGAAVLAAAEEFGRRHAQEMILIARKLRKGEDDPAERLGLTIMLNAEISIDEAVEVVSIAKDCGFKGATFAPKRNGSMAVYHTDNLGMTVETFQSAADSLVELLKDIYPDLQFGVQKYFVHMPQL
jgi:hypothetical protein